MTNASGPNPVDADSSSLNAFHARLKIPASCHLGKRIYKKQFHQHSALNAADKKAFSADIQSIEWCYTLKPATINIPALTDPQREYAEIAILQVSLNADKRYQRIATVMQKAIPYPLLILFAWRDDNKQQWLALNSADKRTSRADADSDKLVIDSQQHSGWINLDQPEPRQQAFLDDFQLPHFSYRDLRACYRDMVRRIIALNCADHSGHYAAGSEDTGNTDEPDRRLTALKQLERLQQQRSELRKQLKRERNIGTQVALNTQIHRLSGRIDDIKQTL